ncbi:kinase-like protein [Vararia minispora EC-137]|uniref:Kinase-like protein n=1 Tax=Vararia minispora EC-137 TaxID=1314806 RepID=A0ACB8QCQ5_9AGAM|nr:kinase-like protein [Vararia minispora EC-137]
MSHASPSAELFEHFPARPGQKLKDGQYTVHRKLGSGVYSTTYLVSDPQAECDEFTNRYRAAKILTVEGTRTYHEGQSRELEFLKQIAACDDIDSLPVLEDHFEERGPEGTHLCLVTQLLSTDVSSFRRSAPNKALPAHTAKTILTQILEALAQLHALGIIHTDVKLDNILFNSVKGDNDVEDRLKTETVAVEGEVEIKGETYPVLRSQPIRHDFAWDASPFISEIMQFVLVDLGQAQRAGEQPTVDEFSAYALRAPELILRSDFGPKVDIWAVGCLAFELLVGRWLFAPEEGEDWTLEDDHLAKMMELTGERCSAAMLERASFRSKYFDEQGSLLRLELIPDHSIEAALTAYKIVPDMEIAGAASFIRACLRLDSSDRPSAEVLQIHPWLMGKVGDPPEQS